MKYFYVNILRATPSAVPFGFAGSPFGGLCASFLTFLEPFWHLGITLGCSFGTSGAPWEAIFAPRDHLGEPWEQQDGNEVARHRIFVDFGMISGPVLLFLVSLCFEFSRWPCFCDLLLLWRFPSRGRCPRRVQGSGGKGTCRKEWFTFLWRAFWMIRPYVFGASVLRIFTLVLFLRFFMFVVFFVYFVFIFAGFRVRKRIAEKCFDCH